MTDSHLDQAREWASKIKSRTLANAPFNEKTLAAAEVIDSLPDQWIDAEKVWEALDGCGGMEHPYEVMAHIEKTLFTPPLPTLADMAPGEREWCQWMQARDSRGKLCVIERITGTARLLYEDGYSCEAQLYKVTPLPDLPRLEWPAQEPGIIPQEPYLFGGHDPTEREQDPEWVDRFMEEPAAELPRPEDVPAGEPWIVACHDHEWVGSRDSRHEIGSPWALSRLDGVAISSASDAEVTLISRLVQEDKP